ncbi:hypothetical protein AVDCRST_MAG94-6528 [uncultured Leptolyngbya sp.]|uniref:Uncharacterized protein n=1 Tax=uncultured Leptolyngbya sp. TaxID=332963 RepID=A0A6J4PHC6_9CYAN|nr:hypothetical protein AVDCRST_MAG94-6528 [uncultured Leptolyngbya sp.]
MKFSCAGPAAFDTYHSACALLVWSRLKTITYQTGRTVYQLKDGLLSAYLIKQLKYPSIQMTLA